MKPSKKKKRRSGSVDSANPVVAAGIWFLTSPYLLLSLVCLGIGLGTVSYPEPMSVVALVVSLAGALLLIVSDIRLIIVAFRVSAGMGWLLLLASVASIWFCLTSQPGTSVGINLVSVLVCVILAIDYWSEFELAVKGWGVSMLMVLVPLFALINNALPEAREAARHDAAQQLAADANHAQPNLPVKVEPKPVSGPVAVPVPVQEAPHQHQVRFEPPVQEIPRNPVVAAPPAKSVPATLVVNQPTGASTHQLTFRIQDFVDQDDPVAAAREALDGMSSVNIAEIAVDRPSAELRIGLTSNPVDTKPIQRSLENVGFRFRPGFNITAKTLVRRSSGF